MFNIRSLFTKESIVSRLKSAPVIKTPVMDAIFTVRPQLGLPVVGAELITEVVAALPLVRRGSPAIAATAKTGAITFYEPFPIHPFVAVTGMDLNNLKVLSPQGREAWAAERQDFLRRTVRMTAEAICATTLTGTLSWPVALEGGAWDTYEVVYGDVLSVTPGTVWNDSGAKLKDVFETLQDMEEEINDKGYGGTLEIWAGKTAYSALFALAEKHTGTAKMKVEISEQGINVGGYLVKRRSEKNKNPQTGAMAPVVPDKEVKMIATDAGHKLPYCALDDLDANLQPMPFFAKPVKMDDPSGYRLIAESKPFPIVNVNGICKAVVIP